MYQQGTIQAPGAAGFSFLCTPGVIAGSLSVHTGDAWVKLQHGPATVVASGANAAVVNPATPPYTDGWTHLGIGEVQNFGTEKVADTTFPDVVVQIDVYCTMASEVGIIMH